MTALMHSLYFSSYPNTDKIRILIEAGTDVNARDMNGKTPLMYAACYCSDSGIITLLLDAGADASLCNEDGRCAVDYIEEDSPLYGTDIYWSLWDASF